MKCPNCNAEISGSAFCPHCGHKIAPPQPVSEHVPPDFYNQYKYEYNYQYPQNNPQQNANQAQTPPVQGAPENNAYYGNQGYYQQPQPPINVNVYQDNQPQYAASYKSRLAALLLCCFLGVMGVHRFYTGKVGTGLLWLFTGGMFGIGYIVDIILIATGSFTDKYGYPLLYW